MQDTGRKAHFVVGIDAFMNSIDTFFICVSGLYRVSVCLRDHISSVVSFQLCTKQHPVSLRVHCKQCLLFPSSVYGYGVLV